MGREKGMEISSGCGQEGEGQRRSLSHSTQMISTLHVLEEETPAIMGYLLTYHGKAGERGEVSDKKIDQERDSEGESNGADDSGDTISRTVQKKMLMDCFEFRFHPYASLRDEKSQASYSEATCNRRGSAASWH